MRLPYEVDRPLAGTSAKRQSHCGELKVGKIGHALGLDEQEFAKSSQLRLFDAISNCIERELIVRERGGLHAIDPRLHAYVHKRKLVHDGAL